MIYMIYPQVWRGWKNQDNIMISISCEGVLFEDCQFKLTNKAEPLLTLPLTYQHFWDITYYGHSGATFPQLPISDPAADETMASPSSSVNIPALTRASFYMWHFPYRWYHFIFAANHTNKMPMIKQLIDNPKSINNIIVLLTPYQESRLAIQELDWISITEQSAMICHEPVLSHI